MKQGFTIIEIIVVIVILAILAGFAIPSYKKWINKQRAEKDIHSLYSLLTLARTKAFTEKKCCVVEVRSNKAILYCTNTIVAQCDKNIATDQTKITEINFDTTITLESTDPYIAFDSTGFTRNNKTVKSNNPYLNNNCVKVHILRIQIAHCD